MLTSLFPIVVNYLNIDAPNKPTSSMLIIAGNGCNIIQYWIHKGVHASLQLGTEILELTELAIRMSHIQGDK